MVHLRILCGSLLFASFPLTIAFQTQALSNVRQHTPFSAFRTSHSPSVAFAATLPRRSRAGVMKVKCIEFAQPELATFPQQMFTLVNFAVLPFWGLMIASPKWELTQTLMRTSIPILLCAAIHLSLVSFGLTQPGSAEEFQFLATQGFRVVKLSAMMEMRQYPVFVSEEWAHVLAWDLFVGRWIYLDGLKKDVPTQHSLFFCFLLGPLGFVMHLLTRAIVKRDASTILTIE